MSGFIVPIWEQFGLSNTYVILYCSTAFHLRAYTKILQIMHNIVT